MDISGYEILSIAYRGNRTIAYQAIRSLDKLKVILKTSLNGQPTSQELANLKYEYNLLKEISIPGLISAYDLIESDNRLLIVLEDIRGKTLKEWMGHRKVKISDFFFISLQLSEILNQLHRLNIVHKDIKPENILIDPETLNVKIIDLSLSSKLSSEFSNTINPSVLEGTLAYISPEQTGRMNRAVDYRSDFYSLGITFYEMLAGRLPFNISDPLDLVYSHLTKMPTSVDQINSDTPKALSNLINKLIAKSSDERYASAFGLKEDLIECQRIWLSDDTNQEFVLGQKDFKSKLLISQKLYGRETEKNQLLEIFDRVCQEGSSELTLVSGSPGIGKSSFIQEIYKPLSRQKGYFVRGKFDALKRNTSYSAFIPAFKDLIEQVLTESDENIKSLKSEILEAVGPNGQLVISLVPELELIIGRQPPVADLSPNEAQNRFNFLFQRFFNVFAKKEHPLVIFIDDLQWSDQASLNLIEQILLQSHYLLIVGSYRDSEVIGQHPLLLTIDFIRQNKIKISEIKLESLVESHVKELVQETFVQGNIEELSSLIFEKTKGNPFFINEFLKSIYQEGLLSISKKGVWQWDIEEIKKKEMTNNVVELLVEKIRKLPPETQEILSLASCIGGQFNLSTIGTVYQKEVRKVAELIWPAVTAGVILTIGSSYKQASLLKDMQTSNVIQYRFLHDRVQEAAYQLISVPERKNIHLKIGRLLLERGIKTDDDLFKVLGHLNYSLDLMTDVDEKKKLTQLNFEGGVKARASSAYSAAFSYFEAAISLLPKNAWSENYPYTFKLYRDFAESEYLVGRLEQAEILLKRLIKDAKTSADKAEIYSILVLQFTNVGRYSEAIESGLKGLRLLGVRLPEHPSNLNLLEEVFRLKIRLLTTSARKKLENLPPMSNVKHLKIMQIMFFLASATYMVNRELFVKIGFACIHQSIDYGYTQGSMQGFISYLLILVSKLHDFKEADFWAKLMIKYSEKLQHIDWFSYFCLGSFYWHWIRPYNVAIDSVNRSIKSSIEEGDINFLAYDSFVHLAIKHTMGKPLDILKKASEETIEVFKREEGFYNTFSLDHYLIESLINGTWVDNSYVDKELENILSHSYSKSSHIFIYSRIGELSYIMEDYQRALELAEKGMTLIDHALGTTLEADQELYYGLALAATLPNKIGKEKRKALKNLKKIHQKYKMYGKNCPENHQYKYLFLTAELEALKGNIQLAGKLYDETIEKAKEQHVTPHIAQACERASLLYQKNGQERFAKIYIQEAFYHYTTWGATLKTKALEKKFPHWVSIAIKEDINFISQNQLVSSSSHSQESLDFLSILKANRAISSEIVLDRLLKKIMKILMENAGGQRGVFLLEKNGKLWIEAEIFAENEEAKLVQQQISEKSDLPLSIFSYVQKTLEPIVLSAPVFNQFTHDPYIVSKIPKSIFCTPIIYQSRLIGILYLENNAVEGAFTKERVEILSFLSAQAAISLDNARLFQATGQFVPNQFLEQLKMRSLVDIRLGDHVQQQMSVLFCDIRNFTALSEKLTPTEAFAFINDFLGSMEPFIEENDGFIDKYIGDAIMALFKGEPHQSVDAAIGMIRELERFNQGKPNPIEIGIGINTGELILGIMGGKKHLSGSVIGDAVNVAARIEPLNKVYGTMLLIGGGAKLALSNLSNYSLRLIDDVIVKGKTVPVEVWEICDIDPKPMRELKMETLDTFNKARALYKAKEAKEAFLLFQECLKKNPDDKVVQFYLMKCRVLWEKLG